MPFNRAIVIVLDSLGIGELPDAAAFSDQGSNTLGNIARKNNLNIPHLLSLGLGNIRSLPGVPPSDNPTACYGMMAEKSAGKDTTTGHWELMGLVQDYPFPTYPNGFPPEIMEKFEKEIGRGTLGNITASGTEIIKELGKEHIKTGYPIIYTSADSVFQIAAHEEVIPPEQLYYFCRVARRILTGKDRVARVIARPFIGKPGAFVRTARRKDFSLAPPDETLLDKLKKKNLDVIGVGKIGDIFALKGLTRSLPTKSNAQSVQLTIQVMKEPIEGLIFTNLVDFDMLYGHRNNPLGYARALEEFDSLLPEIDKVKKGDDIVVLTADHGCDPTTPSTDHSREYVPLLIWGDEIKRGYKIGTRSSFADLGQTLAEAFQSEELDYGTSFLSEILIDKKLRK
jgi:phosphopentomutase